MPDPGQSSADADAQRATARLAVQRLADTRLASNSVSLWYAVDGLRSALCSEVLTDVMGVQQAAAALRGLLAVPHGGLVEAHWVAAEVEAVQRARRP